MSKSQVKRCISCGKKPAAFSRVCCTGSKTKILYSWYQCDHAYPCDIGPCIKPGRKQHKKMVLGWNNLMKKNLEEWRRERAAGELD